jgi:hypothetical protein
MTNEPENLTSGKNLNKAEPGASWTDEKQVIPQNRLLVVREILCLLIAQLTVDF